ncbi:MAG: head-tail adaptor protein [Paracoccus sp. (in: a-proteobacteria)]|nr:head-tail adaptor protein [Paracoccus sp. (in: a-proteobacteria)]
MSGAGYLPALTVPLRLEAPERVPDQMGGAFISWRALGVLYADMRAAPSRESAGQSGPEVRVMWRILTRAFPPSDPRRPRAGQRFCLGARVFRIEAVAESAGGGRILQTLASEEFEP